jgi:hypothetical protein
LPTLRAFRSRGRPAPAAFDLERERAAEQRASALLRSCVNAEEWAMYNELGFILFMGRLAAGDDVEPAIYAYLIYPHKPLVAYLPASGRILSEYCVEFHDRARPYGAERLPAADDVLAKWLALSADEAGLIAGANRSAPGRQIDPERVRRDIARVSTWQHEQQAAARL